MPFYNTPLRSGDLARVISDCYEFLGRRQTIELLDDMNQLGFRQSTLSGLSFGTDDLITPDTKAKIISDAEKQVMKFNKLFQRGVITELERYNSVLDAWTHAREQITAEMNALDYATNDRMLALLDRIETDDGIGAVILTGAGERAFSAGGDIHEFTESIKRNTEEAVREFCRRGQRMTARFETFPKPVIAAVNGIAFGGGCEITEAVHLAVASENAVFAKPEINIGILPTFGGTQRLPRLVGRKRALELLLTGDTFGAQRACELGLVNKVVPGEDLLPTAFDLVERILRHSPLAAARIIAAVTRGLDMTVEAGLLIEREQFARMCATEDVREGLDAWIWRRTPSYASR